MSQSDKNFCNVEWTLFLNCDIVSNDSKHDNTRHITKIKKQCIHRTLLAFTYSHTHMNTCSLSEQSHKASGASGLCSAVTINIASGTWPFDLFFIFYFSLLQSILSHLCVLCFSVLFIYNYPGRLLSCSLCFFCLFSYLSPRSLLGVYIFLCLSPFSFCLLCYLLPSDSHANRAASWGGSTGLLTWEEHWSFWRAGG